MNYRKSLLILIAASTIFRFVLAAGLELGNTEAYYWVFSLKPQWNYFDHPPMVAWLIRLTTLNNYFHTELAVRFGAIVSAAICTLLIFRIGSLIHHERAGWFSALLYTCTIYGTLAAGTFIMPDSPQMVFWFSGILVLCRLVKVSDHKLGSLKSWILFGVLAGLCIMSKVHGVFLWVGAIMYATFIDRNWLKNPGIYISFFITCLIASPILIWNLQNNFATYTFHSERILINKGAHPIAFIKQFLGLVLLYNPVSFYLVLKSLIKIVRGRFKPTSNYLSLILCCSLPLIGILLFISFFRETYAHWSGPGYSTLLFLPAILMGDNVGKVKKLVPNYLKLALAITFFFSFSLFLGTRYFPGTISEEKQGLYIGKDDVSLDMFGWKELGQTFDSLYKEDLKNRLMPEGSPLIVTKWYPAGQEEFYLGYLTSQETIGIGGIDSLHQYFWMNRYKRPLVEGDNAYFVIPSNLFNDKSLDEVTRCFNLYDMALNIPQYRNGVLCKQVYVFRLMGYLKPNPDNPESGQK